MIDIVTPRKGKTHVAAQFFDGGGALTLCGREVEGFIGTTEAFAGDDICKTCAKALPAAQAETEAVMGDLLARARGGRSVMSVLLNEALRQSAAGEVTDRGDFTQYV